MCEVALHWSSILSAVAAIAERKASDAESDNDAKPWLRRRNSFFFAAFADISSGK